MVTEVILNMNKGHSVIQELSFYDISTHVRTLNRIILAYSDFALG